MRLSSANPASGLQQPSIIRLGILLLLFDVYLTWARIERQSVPDADSANGNGFGRLAQQPIVFQYMFFCAHPQKPAPAGIGLLDTC